MTAADIKGLRDQLEAVMRGNAAATPTPTTADDAIIALVTDRLADLRAEDQKRIAALEKSVAAATAGSDTATAGLRASLAAALAATDATLAELAAARAERAKLADQLQGAAKSLARAEARLAELAIKPAADGNQPVGAEAFADLVENFMASLGDRLGTLSLAGGEIALKTAVAPTASGARFVLPSANGPAPAVLHEVRLRLQPKA